MTARLPLDDIRVIDLTVARAGPTCVRQLADWGADVIKIEHAVAGDAQRGLRLGSVAAAEGSFQPLMEHPNRGKRSIGLALDTPGGHQVMLDLVRDAEVVI